MVTGLNNMLFGVSKIGELLPAFSKSENIFNTLNLINVEINENIRESNSGLKVINNQEI